MIEVEHFKKTFRVGVRLKPSRAAVDISFRVEKGEIFGFLGPNGAGKTTTIKALLGLIRADGGTLRLLGHPIDSMEWRAQVGYMPEHPTFYDYLTGLELVTWFGRLSGMNAHAAEEAAKKNLERVGLSHAMRRRLRGYSKGMLQRTGLAQAIINQPQLLILDEPMTGLDPIGRRDIRELILELRDEGKTIFYSTHILPDVEMTCDRVSIIDKGESKRTGRLEDILQETTRGVTVELGGDASWVESVRAEYPDARVQAERVRLEFEDQEAARSFAGEQQQAGAKLLRFEPHRDDLETIFVRSLGGADHQEEPRP